MDAMRKKVLNLYNENQRDPPPRLYETLRNAVQTGEIIDSFDLKGNCPSMRKRRIDNDDIEILGKVLHLNVYITSVDLSYNSITDRGARLLAETIKNSKTISSLNLSYNDFTPVGGEFISEALQINDVIQSVSLRGNKIGNKGGMSIASMLQINTTLQHLDLGLCDLDLDSIIAFATVLNYNSTLKGINLDRPLLKSLQEETTVHISKMLRVNTNLEYLSLRNHGIGNFGAEQLSIGLSYNRCLATLDLSSNSISRDGMKAIAEVLSRNDTLQNLIMTSNRIETDGAIYLSETLKENYSLRAFYLEKNDIGDLGLAHLATALASSSCSVRSFRLWGNNFGRESSKAFAALLTGRYKSNDSEEKTEGRLEDEEDDDDNEQESKFDDIDIDCYVVDELDYVAQKQDAELIPQPNWWYMHTSS
eukprot:Nk52_evm49s236 gene=Nk52_evmTU49s236